MTYAFIRASKYKTIENQELDRIKKLSKEKHLFIEMKIKDESLHKVIPTLCRGDVILCDNVAIFGSTMDKVISNINFCKKNYISIHTYCGISIEPTSYEEIDILDLLELISKKIYSQRIKDALAIKKIEGVRLGRPKGMKSKVLKLDDHQQEIKKLIKNKVPMSAIARKLGVHRITVSDYIKTKGIK